MNKFQTAMGFIAEAEWGKRPDGGYTNLKSDLGGSTKFGISDLRDGVKDDRSSGGTPIKDLTLEQAMEIYRRDYWDLNGLEKVQTPLCIAVFDMFVNMRRDTSQRLWKESGGDWERLIQLRKDQYGRIASKYPGQQVNLPGWMNRMNNLWKFCKIIEQS